MTRKREKGRKLLREKGLQTAASSASSSSSSSYLTKPCAEGKSSCSAGGGASEVAVARPFRALEGRIPDRDPCAAAARAINTTHRFHTNTP